jgi:hypothetical protein
VVVLLYACETWCLFCVYSNKDSHSLDDCARDHTSTDHHTHTMATTTRAAIQWRLPVVTFFLGVVVTRIILDQSAMSSPSNLPQNITTSINVARTSKKSLKVEVDTRPTLSTLFEAAGTDKFIRHHYERYYDRWFAPLRDYPGLKLIEIGANQGHSLKSWSDYFSNASDIMGLAYGDAAQGVEEKVQGLPGVSLYTGDQSKLSTMQYLRQRGPWNIIIDDGSHVPQHMIYSLYHLWDAVVPGGLYVIEDLETNYWTHGANIYGYQLVETGINADANHSAVTKLMQFIHVLTRHQLNFDGEMSVMPNDDLICSIEFGMNLVLLRKCGLPTDGPGPSNLNAPVDKEEMRAWIAQAKASNPGD